MLKPELTFSVILCSRNEQEVIEKTVLAITNQLGNLSVRYEIVVVDDSSDHTPQIVDSLSHFHPVRLVHRSEGQRDGLGGAIVTGLREARGVYVILMDADGQHPPETLCVLAQLALSGFDLVIPSRYTKGGSTGGLDGFFRNLYSLVLRQLPRVIFFKRIWGVTDPLSGFFMVKKSCLDFSKMESCSWKISLEVLLFGHWSSYCEVPYSFRERKGGQSKANFQVGLDYLKHLVRLVKRYYLSQI